MQLTLVPDEFAMRALLAVLARKNQREIRVRMAMPPEKDARGVYGLRNRKPRDIAAADGASGGIRHRTRATRFRVMLPVSHKIMYARSGDFVFTKSCAET